MAGKKAKKEEPKRRELPKPADMGGKTFDLLGVMKWNALVPKVTAEVAKEELGGHPKLEEAGVTQEKLDKEAHRFTHLLTPEEQMKLYMQVVERLRESASGEDELRYMIDAAIAHDIAHIVVAKAFSDLVVEELEGHPDVKGKKKKLVEKPSEFVHLLDKNQRWEVVKQAWAQARKTIMEKDQAAMAKEKSILETGAGGKKAKIKMTMSQRFLRAGKEMGIIKVGTLSKRKKKKK
ncbi:MAG: hypothetical protein KAW41_02175 [Candidatus Diapherotrites archaeon]|nr:hypothetical protein [Candidatus Diapherotrites archaeon]